jgi:hypothetical protein
MFSVASMFRKPSSTIVSPTIRFWSFSLFTVLLIIDVCPTDGFFSAFQPKVEIVGVDKQNFRASAEDTLYSLNQGSEQQPSLLDRIFAFQTKAKDVGSDKQKFLASLDTLDTLNQASKQRTSLLNEMIDQKVLTSNLEQSIIGSDGIIPTLSLENPGSVYSFSKVASGTWKVIYAPHMTTISSIFNGSFDVSYTLTDGGVQKSSPGATGSIVSHAKYDFPIVGTGYLSVSGTYGSVDDIVSRVDFNKAWIKPLTFGGRSNASIDIDSESELLNPYRSLDQVPDGPRKEIINAIGKKLFIESFAVFPVSFLDDDLIVFDFELLGTRICAKKIN